MRGLPEVECRGHGRLGTDGDDGPVILRILLSCRRLDAQRRGILEVRLAVNHLHVSPLCEAGNAVGQLGDDRFLPRAHGIQVESWASRSESRGMPDSFASLISFARMQQRLRGNAAAVQADAAQTRAPLHQHHLLPFVCRIERRRIAAGAGANHHDICLYRCSPFVLVRSSRSSSSNCFECRTRSTMNRAALAPSIIR